MVRAKQQPKPASSSVRQTRGTQPAALEQGTEVEAAGNQNETPTKVVPDTRKRKAPAAPASNPKKTAVGNEAANTTIPLSETSVNVDHSLNEIGAFPAAEDEETQAQVRHGMSHPEWRKLLAEVLEYANVFPEGLEEVQQELNRVRPIISPELAMPVRQIDIMDQDDDNDAPIEMYRALKYHPKQVKQRKRPIPWTEEEEQFLIKKVCKYGAKWSLFEQNFSTTTLYGRNQTALKDKARNIMRCIIDSGEEENWLRKYPKWAEVTVGQARKGFQSLEGGPVERRPRPGYLELMNEQENVGV